ncbi:hypothetical protein ACLMJK_002806 [Lecanora helva]
MAKMLDGPVPDGARSVSWPWYHHTLTTELTLDARTLLEDYSKIPPKDVENHVYRVRDKAWGVFPWPCIGEFWFLSFGLAKHPLYTTMVLPRLRSGDSLLDMGSCMGQDLRKCIYDGAPADKLYASDLFAEYEDLSHDLWRDRDTFPKNHFLAEDILADNDRFLQGSLMTKLGPGQTDMIAINMFMHLFDFDNQLKVATRLLRLLAQKPGSMILGSQAGVQEPVDEPLKPPFDKTEDGKTRTIFRHSTQSFINLWEDAGVAAGVPLRPISCIFKTPKATEASAEGVDTGLEAEEKKPFTAEDLFSMHRKTRANRSSEQETGRLYFSVVRN